MRRITILIPEDLRKRAKLVGVETDQSLAGVTRAALEEYVQRLEAQIKNSNP
jgi:hypothetical protein